MSLIYCPLPLPALHGAAPIASNDPDWKTGTSLQVMQLTCHSNVRLLRRTKENDASRFVLSGRLADVCAALELLAAQEQCLGRFAIQ